MFVNYDNAVWRATLAAMTSSHLEIADIDQIINRVRKTRGWSYRTLSERTDSTVSHQRWQQLANADRLKEFPEPRTITAIAQALDVDVTTVVLALAKSIGLDVRPSPAASDLLPPEADLLSAEQREAIRILIKAMVPQV